MDDIAVFVEVVGANGFSRAAERLGMPATTVSAKIARLEERLGVTLIQRTTRRLHITPSGLLYHEHCVRALATIAEGERALAAAKQEPAGLLRITAPADLAQSLLAPLVERFLQVYPKIAIDFIVTNQKVDLIAEGIDLAVRVGKLDDSSLVIRKFRSGRIALWASRAYLDRKGIPRAPAELACHDLIRFSRMPARVILQSADGATAAVDFNGRLASDDLDNLKALIQRGNGIGLLPQFIGEDSTARTSLVHVLPAYASDVSAVHFAYPAQKYVPQTVRAFIAIATGERV